MDLLVQFLITSCNRNNKKLLALDLLITALDEISLVSIYIDKLNCIFNGTYI